MSKAYTFIILLLSLSIGLNAEVRLPAIIGSHMVLQQQSEVNLWGWSSAAEKIKITVSWDPETSYETIGTNGANWTIKVKTPKAGGPYTITINGSNEIVLEDVMIGEVWVCSGQSNMEWSADQGLQQSKDELPYATNTSIRFFYIPKTTSEYPQDDVHARWVVCHPMAMLHFSAVGYFFGKKLNSTLGVPVGLINSNWGGTPAETWTPKGVVESDELLSKAAAELKEYDWWPSDPGISYNAMIHPLTNYRIAGTIWYQGESNVGTHYAYRELFVQMIDAWRGAWGYDFPFYFVQIAPFDYGSDNINGALLREAQTKASSHENTGMVVVSDLVDDVKNIHPVEKILVAERLANYALTSTYGLKGLPHNSPVYQSHLVEGDKIRVKFDHVPTGLKTSGGPVSEFYISGNDGVFLPAEARIDGKTVIVHHKNIKSPKDVRYAFSNTAIGNLFSAEGLPVNLFRTDQ